MRENMSLRAASSSVELETGNASTTKESDNLCRDLAAQLQSKEHEIRTKDREIKDQEKKLEHKERELQAKEEEVLHLKRENQRLLVS